MELQFDKANKIVGGRITDYLLEKTRVLSQNKLERNFHIFYNMMAGPYAKEYGLQYNNQLYNCMKMSSPTAPGLDDEAGAREVHEGFQGLGFSDKEEQDLYSVVVGTLYLGNVLFEDATVNGGDGSIITDASAIDNAAKYTESEFGRCKL